MRRLLAGAVLGGLLLAAPYPALALDYAPPTVPEAYGGPAPTATVDGTPNDLASPQTVPNDPAYVPHNTWDDAESGGCALWNWDTC
jgi:hypothetical protein